MILGEEVKVVSALPYDVRLLLEERNIAENQMNWGVIIDLFLESIATFAEFYGFNENRKALFKELKKDKREASQIIKIYKEYREWFEMYKNYFEKLQNVSFLTICKLANEDVGLIL
ncbi:hypothetical protein ACVQ8P_06015 [Dellaglioa sp. BT-FLS60]